MPRRCLLGGLVGGLLWGSLLPAPAAAVDLSGWLRGNHRSRTAEYLGGAEPGAAVPPGSQLHLGRDLLRPQYGPVPVVPSYNWGYFGAPYRGVSFCHKGYYDDCLWWCYRRRY